MAFRWTKQHLVYMLIALIVCVDPELNPSSYFSENFDRWLQSSADIDDTESPEIAWLMAFPQAGSMFLHRSIHIQTQTSTGVNFGQASMDENGNSLSNKVTSTPTYSGDEMKGPYLYSNSLPYPKNAYILTRTFCAGFCTICLTKHYDQNSADYLYECSETSRFDGNEVHYGENYDWHRVKKIVHLTRNPVFQVAARFCHKKQGWKRRKRIGMVRFYPQTGKGFRKFCLHQDTSHQKGLIRNENRHWNRKKYGRDLANNIPCHADFYRIVHWHNNFFEVIKNQMKDVPVKHIFYEDLISRPQEVLDELYDFLNLTKVVDRLPPLENVAEDIKGYYTPEQLNDIKKFVKFFGSSDTLNHFNQVYDFL